MTHRSRTHWPEPLEPPSASVHMPRQKRAPLVIAYAAIAVLMVTVGLMLALVLSLKASRDAETERIEEKIRQSICDLLDQLPEGGLLDRPRAKYGCGPGMPIDLLTPEERAQLSGRLPAPTSAPLAPMKPSGPAPRLGDPASPDRPAPPPAMPVPSRPPGAPPRPTPVPVPTTPPSGPLDPITEPVCNTLSICLEVS